MKFNVICADPPYSFSDKLSMSDVKRGADSQYQLISNKDIKNIDVKSIVADDAVLALWVPSSLLKEGIEIMENWGFVLKQSHIWVKTKQEPLKELIKDLLKIKSFDDVKIAIKNLISFDFNNILYFGMGRLFRQTHEIVLIGTRGKIYQHLANKSQRSVHFAPIGKHSKKPESLQDMLDVMFPDMNLKKIELFARRNKPGYLCVGNQCPGDYFDRDIRDCIKELENTP